MEKNIGGDIYKNTEVRKVCCNFCYVGLEILEGHLVRDAQQAVRKKEYRWHAEFKDAIFVFVDLQIIRMYELIRGRM